MGLGPETFDQGPQHIALQIMFIISIVFVFIVLLNLLIAMMTNSYQDVASRTKMELTLLRAEIILEQELFMHEKDFNDPSLFPWFTHTLTQPGVNETVDPNALETSGIRALNTKLNVLDRKVEKLISAMQGSTVSRGRNYYGGGTDVDVDLESFGFSLPEQATGASQVDTLQPRRIIPSPYQDDATSEGSPSPAHPMSCPSTTSVEEF
jgi:hypothetical protein